MIEALKIIGIVLGSALAAAVGLILLYVLLLVIAALCVNTKKEYTTRNGFYEGLFSLSTFLVCKLFLMKVVVTGKEKLPQSRFLFVCNHRSNFDPIISRWIFWKEDVAFISKPENFKIPIAKQIIMRCRYMSIDRENPRNSMKTLLKAIEFIKNDQGSIGIYPEGTRSKDCRLLPFHDGVFKIAQKANVPIVVGSIVGSENVKKRFPFRRTVIRFDIIDVITPQAGQTSHEIAEAAKTLISDKIFEYERGRYELNEKSDAVSTLENEAEKTEQTPENS